MMQLGQAVGTAVALAREGGLQEVPAGALRKALRAEHVQLGWPMSEEVRGYLAAKE